MSEILTIKNEAEASEKEKIERLREALKETYGYPDFFSVGHGTSEEVALKTFTEGLQARTANLDETATFLYHADKPYDEQPDEVFQNFLHWKHRDYKHIVIVMVPSPQEDQPCGNKYANSIFEELPPEEKVEIGVQGADKKYVIPAKFIKGYIDANKLKFIVNPNFDPPKRIGVKNTPAMNMAKTTENDTPVTSGDDSNNDIW